MRQNPDLEALLFSSHPIATQVEVWYANTLQIANLPITDGTVSFDDSATVKRTCELTVPAYAGTTRYDPGDDPLAPLNNFGQRLHIRNGVVLPNGVRSYVDLGWFLITSWQRSEPEATVTVKGADLSALLVDDKLLATATPQAAGTFYSEAVRLVNTNTPVRIDPILIDRPVAASTVYERERTDAIDALCAAWPARWYVDDRGMVTYTAPYAEVTASSAVDVTVSDGSVGSIISRARDGDRGRQYNIVVVEGVTPDDGTAPPRYVAQVTDPASPIVPTGPFGRRPRFFSSDLITSQAQAQAVAENLLAQWKQLGRSEVVSAVPDPRIQLGDVARVYTKDGDTFLGRVSKLDLPLTATEDGMQLTVSTVADDEETMRRRRGEA